MTVLMEQQVRIWLCQRSPSMQTEEEPYLVRRKKHGASAEMSPGGSRAGQVDWRQSLLLNLAVHSAYWLTVAAGPTKALPAGVLGTAEAPPGSVKVQQRLHTPIEVRNPRGCAGKGAQADRSGQC